MEGKKNYNKEARLIEIFTDTRNMSLNDDRLRELTEEMKKHSRLYKEGFCSARRDSKGYGFNIKVVEDTTFHCAAEYAKDPWNKVAVLNFANGNYPGGGVTAGCIAQEECLCRSSNLYEGLIMPYFKVNYYGYNKANYLEDSSDRLIYHPGVTVFKNDEVRAELLSEKEWFKVDVITCAAPRFRHGVDVPEDLLFRMHYWRAKNILEAAMDNGVDILILGAFGCGAFHNPPEIVASVYKKLLIDEDYKNHFRDVILAIKKDHNDTSGNYKTFSKVIRQDYTFFWKEDQENGEFSQWYPSKLVIEGIEYNCCEQYMMAKKALMFGDLNTYQKIMQENDPQTIKALGKQVTPFDAGKWNAAVYEIILRSNYAKFSRNERLKNKLLNTNNSVLAEASPYDKIYGIGLRADDENACNKDKWPGSNMLGRVLTDVRDRLYIEENMENWCEPPHAAGDYPDPEFVETFKRNATDRIFNREKLMESLRLY